MLWEFIVEQINLFLEPPLLRLTQWENAQERELPANYFVFTWAFVKIKEIRPNQEIHNLFVYLFYDIYKNIILWVYASLEITEDFVLHKQGFNQSYAK